MLWCGSKLLAVAATTIINCFHHCNFSAASPEESIAGTQSGMNGLIDDLKLQRGMEDEGQFKDFSFVNSDV